MKKTTTDRWVLVSNFTQTLDLFGELLEQNNMKFQRLDGSINANKRQVRVRVRVRARVRVRVKVRVRVS